MKNIKTEYSPLYFLASLWAWWLAVSFFMYLMFLTKHSTSIPTFDTLKVYFDTMQRPYIIMILLAGIWIIFFSIMHIQLLIGNIKKIIEFKKSINYKNIKNDNNEVNLMTIPLTLGMSINIIFIVFAVFVPWLWKIVEYLFPFSILAFLSIGIYALKLLGDYYTRIITQWWFDHDKNNNLSQLIATMAFAMIWVGLAAPAAMTQIKLTSGIALFFSIFFFVISAILLIINIVLWFKSIFKKWLNIESAPSIWVIIPILTLWWITLIRQEHSLSHIFGAHIPSAILLLITTTIISIQLFFGFIWYKALSANKYFKEYLNWNKKSPWTYSLICPWVALFVFSFFFIEKWLVLNGILTKFSIFYFMLLIPMIYLQFKTIKVLFSINKSLL